MYTTSLTLELTEGSPLSRLVAKSLTLPLFPTKITIRYDFSFSGESYPPTFEYEGSDYDFDVYDVFLTEVVFLDPLTEDYSTLKLDLLLTSKYRDLESGICSEFRGQMRAAAYSEAEQYND